jgi:hypothetical protein
MTLKVHSSLMNLLADLFFADCQVPDLAAMIELANHHYFHLTTYS